MSYIRRGHHFFTSLTSAKKKCCLCDLPEKRHHVFSSVTSVASVVPLCRLCGKKALCTFLNEISLFFHCGKYIVPFFHRGDTEAPQRPQRPQRSKHDAFFQRGHRGATFLL